MFTHIAVLSTNVKLSVLARKDPDAPKTALRSFNAVSLNCKYSRELMATTHECAVVDTSLQNRDKTMHPGAIPQGLPGC